MAFHKISQAEMGLNKKNKTQNNVNFNGCHGFLTKKENNSEEMVAIKQHKKTKQKYFISLSLCCGEEKPTTQTLI